MKRILTEITRIDEKTVRLAKHREILSQQYEELKDAKLIRDAKTCSVEQDWENGTCDMDCFFFHFAWFH